MFQEKLDQFDACAGLMGRDATKEHEEVRRLAPEDRQKNQNDRDAQSPAAATCDPDATPTSRASPATNPYKSAA